jgi:hypothetical protein
MEPHTEPLDPPSLEQLPQGADDCFRANLKDAEEIARFDHLYALWMDAFAVVKRRQLEDPKIREPTDEEIEYARAQAEIIKRVKEAYPGIKPAPVPRRRLAPEFRRLLRNAKHLRHMPRQALVNPGGPGLVIRSLELYTKIQAQADELHGLIVALAQWAETPHQLAIAKAMVTWCRDMSHEASG